MTNDSDLPAAIDAIKIESARVREILQRRGALPGDMGAGDLLWMRALLIRAHRATETENLIECKSLLLQLRNLHE